ncbi:MAG: zinc ribbon domain-containing protein [Sedimenticola sp.]
MREKNSTLGSNETFMCMACTYATHRDINGARNILLKALGGFPFA